MNTVLNPIVSRLVNTLIDLTNEELHSILGVPKEIQNLRYTLCLIQDVLDDAEQRSITEKGVKRWLSCLTDVMYDADDILDEYRIAAEEWASQENLLDEPSLGSQILPFFACFDQGKVTYEIGSRIRDLNVRLEQILALRSTLDLRVSDRRRKVTRVGRQTSSEVEPDIVGEAIEKGTSGLVDLLMRKDEDANANVVVLAIVGIGGMGKTTLAQKIFNDLKIKAVFAKTMWVCVSQEFVATDLLREIIASAGESPGEAQSEAQLATKVNCVLKNRKFLLVLDDIWDAQIWVDLLRKPLQVGAVRSRVLVTTRNQRVAERMKAIHIHNVNPLSLDDSWLLLCKKVTKNAEEEGDIQSLKDIGMRIVEKCRGLPLAITVVGGVLCGKLSRWEWEQVERSSAWSQTGLPDRVHQALYLSYEDLLSHLKQCFLHCSLFREDSKLVRSNLVMLWVAEGFVAKVEGEEYPSLEKIAEGYYDELVQRSLLQIPYYGTYWICTIHDLLRSMCHFLARGESSVIRHIYKPIAHDDSIKLRRLSIVALETQDIKPFLHLTQTNKSVRTLLLETVRTLDDRAVEDCFNNLQRLRVIDLCHTRIQHLPQSIKNLLHLRYLNLSYCIRLKALPESIVSLKNLQFLILEYCINLRTLPEGVVKLRNLRTLDLFHVPLKELPSGIARLEHLNVLKGAVVRSNSSDNSSSNSSSCSLEEISKLCNLRELSIFRLWKTSDKFEHKINDLNRFTALEDLVALDLFWGPPGDHIHFLRSYTEEERQRIEQISNVALHPPSHVRRLRICHFPGLQFPSWLMSKYISSLLPNLIHLILEDCSSCSKLPPLGKLPNLESLTLEHLYGVTNIDAEFFGYGEASTSVRCEIGGSKSASSSPALFPRLKRLCLDGLYNLEEWHWVPEDAGMVAMPRLIELCLHDCPKLRSLPKGLNCQVIRLTQLRVDERFFYHLSMLEVLELYLEEDPSVSLAEGLVCSLPHLTEARCHRLTPSETVIELPNSTTTLQVLARCHRFTQNQTHSGC